MPELPQELDSPARDLGGSALLELPDRHRLWREWNLQAWGGKLPGPDAIRAAYSRQRNLARSTNDIPWPSPDHLKLEPGHPGRCWRGGRSVPVERIPNPQPNGSFGFASAVIKVEFPKRLSEPAELVLPLDPKAKDHVVAPTIRLFRWRPESQSFELQPMSASAAQSGLVWGRIRESGVYVAVGYPRDPIVRHTAKLM